MWPHSSPDVILGTLLERSENNGRTLERLEGRAIQRFDQIDGRLDSMSRELTTIAKRQAKPPVSPLERRLKNLAGYLVPLAVLFGTGSVQTALDVLKALR
jgi:hypothetical protein